MARTKGSKNRTHSAKSKDNYSELIATKTAEKEQVAAAIAELSENFNTIKAQLKEKKAELKSIEKEIAKVEAKKSAAEAKAAEEAKKAEAEAVLKKLLASGMTADEILSKLQ